MSLRRRLILSYALVVIVCLGIIGIAVSVLVQSYRDRYTMTYLASIAQPIYVQLRLSVSADVASVRQLTGLQEQATDNNVYILLLDARGNITRQISPDSEKNEPPIEPVSGLPARFSKAQQGKFETESGETYIYAAQPLGFEGSSARTLVLAVPRGQPVAIFISLIQPLLYTGIIALAVSIVIALFLARSFYRPVQRITEAAEKIAQGQYDQRIEEAGPKEIRGLAISFNKMSQQVKLGQERLRHFVADVSHQLKSPLTSINGFAQAIIDGTAVDKETRLKSAHIIQEESKKMMRQVDELLELSRMQSGQLRFISEPVDMEDMLKQLRDIFAPRLEEKNLHLKMDIPLLPEIRGDADRLEQVFSNLMDNAIKNSPNGADIQVIARKFEHYLEIAIIDAGPGIPPEQIPYVFERFYQAMGVRTGVGLGLAIAREILLAHGGEIRVTSEPGEKTEFIIWLPVNH